MNQSAKNSRFGALTLRSLLALGVLAVLVGWFLLTTYGGYHRPPAPINSIVSNLHQLDGAAQLWAIENKQTGAVSVTRADVARYLKDGWVKPVGDEEYVLRGLSNSPEAVLTRKLGGRPEGTVIRLGTNGDFEIIPPKR